MAGKPGTKRKKAYTVADVDGFREDLSAILEKFDAFALRFRDAKLGETRLAIDGADGIRQGFAQLHRWLSKMVGELDAETSPQRGEWVADLPESGPNKCFGICADFDAVTPLRYTTVGLDPFHIGTDAVDGVQRQIGSPRDEPLEKNHSKIGWTDNIHNQSFLGR